MLWCRPDVERPTSSDIACHPLFILVRPAEVRAPVFGAVRPQYDWHPESVHTGPDGSRFLVLSSPSNCDSPDSVEDIVGDLLEVCSERPLREDIGNLDGCANNVRVGNARTDVGYTPRVEIPWVLLIKLLPVLVTVSGHVHGGAA